VRESAQSWRELLLDLKRRGLAMAPELAVADGALGFWQAIEEVWPKTRGQRCWVQPLAAVALRSRGGRIMIDADPARLRRQISVVLQDNVLLNRSVRDNIALSNPALPTERVRSPPPSSPAPTNSCWSCLTAMIPSSASAAAR
jgi:Transposase, Mutator family